MSSVEQIKEDDWTIIEGDQEFETFVAPGLEGNELGMSLIINECQQNGENDNLTEAERNALIIAQNEKLIRNLEMTVFELQQKLEYERKESKNKIASSKGDNENLQREVEYWRSQCTDRSENRELQKSMIATSVSTLKDRFAKLTSAIIQANGSQSNRKSEIEFTQEHDIEDMMHNLHISLTNLEEEVLPAISKIGEVATLESQLRSRIALSGFANNDIALFFPTHNGDYLAFNIGSPHHYLSEESKSLIDRDKHFRKIYVLGKIVMKEKRVASKGNSPYRLAPGVTYYVVTLSSVTDMLESKAR